MAVMVCGEGDDGSCRLKRINVEILKYYASSRVK